MRYAAFSSDIHADARWARWLHRRLVPCALDRGALASNGGVWANVSAANGAPYGGLHAGGICPGHDGAAIKLGFAATTDARYRFVGDDALTFQEALDKQLSTHGNTPRTRVINDKCTGDPDGADEVVLTDTTANTPIACDPAIRNLPR